MKPLYLMILLFSISFYLLACKPSARFSNNKYDDQIPEEKRALGDTQITELQACVNSWLNTPYHYGGISKSGIDCSGFSSIVMMEVYNIKISRTAEQQFRKGQKVRDGWRMPGDLVFFKNVRGAGVDHVGIYLGNNKFVHASARAGVIISDMNEDYYRKRYTGSCRYWE